MMDLKLNICDDEIFKTLRLFCIV